MVLLLVVMPKIMKIDPYIVRSGSMEPVIKVGSLAFIDTDDKNLHPGEIGAYELADGSTVTHRLVSVEGDEYLFKGDANSIADLSTVSKSQIVGTYLFSIPKLGYVLEKVTGNLMYIWTGIAGLVLLIVLQSLLE